jgi:lambda family phage portal protein
VFQWARSLFGIGRAAKSAEPVAVRARYDNADTNPENQRHWWAVDALSAKAANSYQVRRTLRMRSRYEVANNPFLFGVVHSNADDLIDTGPTLQVYSGDPGYDRAVEASWREWCAEVGLVARLKTAKVAKSVDGEGFLVLKTVEDLEHPVKLYPCDVEADQVTTPAPQSVAELWVDGVILHKITGRPTHYTVLKHHPGDYYFPDLNPYAVEKIAARHVVHWFTRSRPGQVRGVPVFTSSLDLFTELRAFRRAVLGAAEVAADYAAVLEQDRETGAYDTDDDTDGEMQAFKRVPVGRKMMTALPPGARMNQFDAKQPTTTYEMFQEKCLGEACRPLNYPLNLALGTSQKFNFSSAKLDHVNYRNGLTIERDDCNKTALEHIFAQWFPEAVLSGAIPVGKGLTPPRHEWHWPGFEPLDPVTDAQADHERLSNGTDTYQRFWARRGLDWQDVMRQQSREQTAIEKLGLQYGEPAAKTISETTTTDGDPPPGSGPARRARRSASGDGRRGHHKPGQYAGGSRLRAKKDDNGQEHDESGRFGEGSGGGKNGASGSGADADDPYPHQETHDDWSNEDTDRAEKRDKQDAKTESARERQDAADTKARDREDAGFDAREEKIDRAREKVESGREKEDVRRDKQREKEDDAHQEKADDVAGRRDDLKDAREKEDARLAKGRDREDLDRAKRQVSEEDALRETHEKEDAAEEKRRAAFDAPDAEHDDDELEKEDSRREAYDAHGDADRAELAAQHEAEEAAVESARDEQDAARAAARAKDDADLAAEEQQLDAEYAEREKARDTEDAERESARAEEDAAHEAEVAKLRQERDAAEQRREAEDDEWRARWVREDAETAAARDAEDLETYHARKKDDPAAHASYDGYDEAAHQKHSAKKSESARGDSLRAKKDDEGHEHADDGKFTDKSGSGGAKKGDAKKADTGKRPMPSADHTKPAEKTDSGHADDSPKALKARAKKIAQKIKKHGVKAVAVAKRVGEAAKHAAFNATWAAMKLGIKANDIGDDVHDYSKVINAKGTGDWLSASRVKSQLGVSGGFAATVASHVLAFGLTKLNEAIARRRARKEQEAKEKESKSSLYEPGRISAAEPTADELREARAECVARVLGAFYGEMGCPDEELPTPADVLAWMTRRDQKTETADASAGVRHGR